MVPTSIESLEYLTDDERSVLGEIRQAVQSLAGEKLTAIYLFGSKARGDFDPGSDLDIAVIVDDLDREMKRKIIDAIIDVELKYLLHTSTLVMSLQDFQALRQRERRIALDIEREGIPL